MSKSNAHFGDRTRWIDVSFRKRCPVCQSDSWCQLGDGDSTGVVLCKRVASDHQKINAEGVTFWVHRSTATDPQRQRTEVYDATPERAQPRVCDAVYRRLLDELALDASHRAALLLRGLSDQAIKTARYRSMPSLGRATIAKNLIAQEGQNACSVPGFVKRENVWTIAGCAGLLIPVRDERGLIRALKVRSEDRREGMPRYSSISSSKYNGPKAENACHVPIACKISSNPREIMITEGELKADVATHLSGVATLSIPGVGAWRTVIATIARINPDLVTIVFDADSKTKAREIVERHCAELKRELLAAGFRARRATIDPREGKGIDDVLLARMVKS